MSTFLSGKNAIDAKHKQKRKIKPGQSTLTIIVIKVIKKPGQANKKIAQNSPNKTKVIEVLNINTKPLCIIIAL